MFELPSNPYALHAASIEIMKQEIANLSIEELGKIVDDWNDLSIPRKVLEALPPAPNNYFKVLAAIELLNDKKKEGHEG